MEMLEYVDDKWICKVDDQLTFCGVLNEHYGECSRNWHQEATRKQYQKVYNEKILPNLPDEGCWTMDQYSMEDFEAVMEAIARKGKGRKGTFEPYSDASLQQYRYLIVNVVEVAAKHRYCDNLFWGATFCQEDEDNKPLSLRERYRAIQRKSFTPEEERRIFKKLAMNPYQRGQEMGLLLMFALGLRNGEACGANFEDVYTFSHQGNTFPALLVCKTTESGTNVLQVGGKTANADRIVPIPGVLMDVLEKRRKYIEEQLGKDVGSYPITCMQKEQLDEAGNMVVLETDWTKRCGAHHLTAAARRLFAEMKFPRKELVCLEEVLKGQADGRGVVEREPTAYLFRRNLGTILHILGFTDAQIQYIIGHEIEDMYETRNEFINEEKLYELKCKLDQRILFRRKEVLGKAISVCLDGKKQEDMTITHQKIEMAAGVGKLKLTAVACEPADVVQIKIKSKKPPSKPMQAMLMTGTSEPQFERELCVLEEYKKAFL